jgi:hypothetical protein
MKVEITFIQQRANRNCYWIIVMRSWLVYSKYLTLGNRIHFIG